MSKVCVSGSVEHGTAPVIRSLSMDEGGELVSRGQRVGCGVASLGLGLSSGMCSSTTCSRRARNLALLRGLK